MKAVWTLLKQSFSEWSSDKAATLAAALAYYTIFALAPLLVIVIAIVSLVFGQEAAQGTLEAQISSLVGKDAASLIQTMIQRTQASNSGVLATVVSVVILLFGASGLFAQLQSALNQIWNVEPKPSAGFMHLLRVRLLSLGMVLVIGFLLLVSLLLSAALTALGSYFSNLLPGADFLWQLLNFALSFAVITGLFALIYKVLPDAVVAWRDVWIGSVVTSLLFTIGKFLISFYLARSAPASAYGAAGSLIVLLLWVYYSAQILLFGAEFTQVYSRHYGSKIVPDKHAQFVK